MLGSILRLKIAIVLAVLGLLVLGTGIGQRTIWLPPATLTAAVSPDVKAAPLTVIGSDLLKTQDGRFTLTVKNDGPIQLAVARADDITGWIADAAYTRIGAAGDDFKALSAESVAGAETVPNPSGSDMWVSEEKGTGELTYTWQAPGHGDWELLLSSDGKAPAPTNISITVDNNAGTPWAVPLMVIGSALLALAALLFFMAPRKSKVADASGGRRAAGRTATDPATADAKPDSKDDSGDDAGPRGDDTPSKNTAGTASSPAKDSAKAAEKKDGKMKFAAVSAQSPRQVRTVRNSVKARWGAVLATALLAGGMSPAVAADTTTPAPTPSASTAATTGAAATTDAATPSAMASAAPATAGFPNLLDSQVEHIAAAVAAVVASGDNAKNAKELAPRVAGMALNVRTANYKIRTKVEKQAAVEPVSATKLLARVVTTNRTWPRSAMLVTQGTDNSLPQLLTLVQASPRENYKLIHATPLLPGQTFPTVDKEGTEAVALDSATDLKMSPKAAISALSDRLTNADSKFKDSFNDSVYISSVLDLQKKVVADAKDAMNVFSHKGDLGSALAMRTADGGAMVVVGNDFAIGATSKKAATLTVGADAAVFTGGTETTKGFTLHYAEPVVMYVPPTGGPAKITVLSATRSLVGGSFK